MTTVVLNDYVDIEGLGEFAKFAQSVHGSFSDFVG